MLNLVFDIKIGYEKFYIVEKDVEYSLDFIFKDQEDHALEDLFSTKKEFPKTEDELLAEYGATPDTFIKDYNLFRLIRMQIEEFYRGTFSQISLNSDSVFFPELFTIYNCRFTHSDDDKTESDREDDLDCNNITTPKFYS